jgi:hypothetical protein
MIPRRLFWAASGWAAGAGSVWWVRRRVRRTLRRARPDAVAARSVAGVGARWRRARAAVAAGVAEGRLAARERETELRLRYGLIGDGPPRVPGSPSGGPAPSPAGDAGPPRRARAGRGGR